MPNENSREVYRALRDAQTRYAYFLLAAAAAAIGFAINQTQTATLAVSQIWLALAVLSWGLSFYSGCKHLTHTASVLYDNATLLQVQHGEHPLTGTHPEAIAMASQWTRESLERGIKRGGTYAVAQFRLMVGGSVLFIGWHIHQMYLRTFP